jgi:hypothetical protein
LAPVQPLARRTDTIDVTGGLGLQAEDGLDLVPDRQEQRDRGCDEQEDGDDEAEPRPGALAVPLHPGASPRTVEPVGAVDRVWVDGRVVRNGADPARWLGHSPGF